MRAEKVMELSCVVGVVGDYSSEVGGGRSRMSLQYHKFNIGRYASCFGLVLHYAVDIAGTPKLIKIPGKLVISRVSLEFRLLVTVSGSCTNYDR